MDTIQRITVINLKGGCGKTTIATNLASAYACAGRKTTLIDYDPQGSSMFWLNQRDEQCPPIEGIAAYPSNKPVTRSFQLRLQQGAERVIVDTPAGLKGLDLIDQLKGTHSIVIPVLPSSIDTHATADFIRDLYLIAKVQPRQTRLCILCNRVKPNTLAFQSLERFLKALDIPVVARLRETQNYVKAAEAGLGVHELGSRGDEREVIAWRRVIEWLDDNNGAAEPQLIIDNTSAD